MKFRKKPVVVEAIQWTGVNVQAMLAFTLGNGVAFNDHAFSIHTREGMMRADQGDWIIKGVQGEFYPCKPDVFVLTYEPVA